MVRTALEVIRADSARELSGHRIGLVVNQASICADLVHARRIISRRFGKRLTALFGPQHGIFGERQDNMVESPHAVDAELDIPVHSLYSETRKPTPEMLNPIDVLVIDLQDVGTRVYTFVYTMAYCMIAAREANRKVVVLDRPNPVGGLAVEGNPLNPAFASFVGLYPIPMRHGMTIGELARLFNEAYEIGCDLSVIPMEGWRRRMQFHETGLPWVMPSPNLPTPDTALVYPGQVLLEGTNLSEGRGTTRPFELFGAPYIDCTRLAEQLGQYPLPGVRFREHHFIPTFHKWAQEVCHGFQLHVTDGETFRPYRTTLCILHAVQSLWPDAFAWRLPPYEYEHEKLPIDILLGEGAVREQLERLVNPVEIEADWQEALQSFLTVRQHYLLYEN
jgi:uncharacterized protein YbbC (DUF1343 family)